MSELGQWLPRIGLAALLGGLIGLERQINGRPAGLRTHMLVCLAAALIAIAGEQLLSGDLARIVAGVLTGIGFLGAGAIVRTGDFVRGLTTAACIWFVAVMGVVTGLGLLLLASFGCAAALVVLVLLDQLEALIPPVRHRKLTVISGEMDPEVLLKRCRRALNGQRRLRIQDVHTEVDLLHETVTLGLFVRVREKGAAASFAGKIACMEGIRSVTWTSEVSD